MKQIKNGIEKINQKLNIKNSCNMYILVIIISLVSYCCLYGFNSLNPQNVNWILQEFNDFENGYLAWKAFRNSPWMFPFGFMNTLSYPEYTSVMFSGAIPGMALFFKLINAVLPATFQYFGIWTLLCMILMGVYSSKILYRLSQDRYIAIVGSVFFILIPIMHMRIFAHTGLDGQWLLIAAFDMCLDMREKEWKKNIWFRAVLFGMIAILQHSYFLPIVAVILLYGVIYNIINGNGVMKNVILLIAYTIAGFATVYLLGGFSTNISRGTAGGLGQYSMNLNALFNPRCDPELWSKFISPLPYHHNGQQEGFAYLGLGIIILLIIDVFFFIAYMKKKIKMIKRYAIDGAIAFFVLAIALFISLSPLATVGEKTLYEIKLPDNIENIWAIFRSSGRFSWILVYAIMLFAIISFHKMQRTWSAYLLILVLILQIIDLSNIFLIRRDEYTKEYEYEPYTNTDSSWDEIEALDSIRYVYFVPDNYAFTMKDNFIITDWALNRKMAVNAFYFSHQDSKDIISNNSILALSDPKKDSLFIFPDKEMVLGYAFDNLHYYQVGEFIIGYVSEIENLKANAICLK